VAACDVDDDGGYGEQGEQKRQCHVRVLRAVCLPFAPARWRYGQRRAQSPNRK
jgi:hypothetical protein